MCVGSSYFKIGNRGLELDADGNIVPKLVEIDESKFFHRKYHRGEYREGRWVFGGIERGSNRCFMAEVERRDGATLLQIIKDVILPGTHIISDNGAYTHDVINHEDNFVDPNNLDIHTQNIDSMSSRAKRIFRQMYYSIPTWSNSCDAPHLVVMNHFVQYCSTVSTVDTSYKRLFL